MTGEESSALSRKRTTIKNINYNEKDADAELVQRIEQLEEARTSHQVTKPKRGRGGGIVTNCSANSTDKVRYQKFLSEKSIGWNFIPSVPPFFRKASRFSTVLDLEDALVDVEAQLVCSHETTLLRANDTIYMVSEPPGEPYYIGRVIEFVCKQEFRSVIDEAATCIKKFPVKFFQVRMNWFYRPRDIQNRFNNLDPRLLYASLHQDVCPIESYRGKCSVVHENAIGNITSDRAEYCTIPNNFYFNQLFDRYTRKYYKVVPTLHLLKLQSDSPFLCVLNKRFQYIYVEENYPLEEVLQKYVLEEDRATKTDDALWCERCSVCREWCTKPLSLKCDECTQAVHLYCMDPPLDRKPNKGVIWLCFRCLKQQEDTVEALKELEKDEAEEKEFFASFRQKLNDAATKELQKSGSIREKCYWIQYMGRSMVNHLDDLIDEYLFLPYPIKCSRVGYKYQWSGCMDDRSVFPQPYSSDNAGKERGTEATAELLWDMSNTSVSPGEVDGYVEKCKVEFSPKLNMLPESCNFLDMAVRTLMKNDFNFDLAFKKCGEQASRELLQEPTFTEKEVEQFERAIGEYGSELLPVSRCVKTQPMSMIVRYYYNWKKTPSGRKIWGNYKGRRKNMGKKPTVNEFSSAKTEERKSKRDRKPTRLALESEGDNSRSNLRHADDSSFETESASSLATCFHCMFCEVDYSPMWYKVTGGSDDDYIKSRMQTGVNEKTETSDVNSLPTTTKSKGKNEKFDALCIRCARLWRRYGVKWQHPLTVLKRLNGPSIASLHATLQLIFSDTKSAALQLSPQQAHNKYLEWELVQDAELISRQREELVKDPERLIKMKKNTMASRAQFSKMVRRPFDRTSWCVEHMMNDLEKYMQIYQRKIQQLELKEQKGNRKKKFDKLQQPNSSGNVVEKKEIDREKTPSVDPKNSQRLKLDSHHILSVKIPNKDENIGEIMLSADGKYVQMDDGIYTQLMSRLIPGKRTKSSELFSTAITNKRIKREKAFSVSENNGGHIHASHESKITVLENEENTTALLSAYHKRNAFDVSRSNELEFENNAPISGSLPNHFDLIEEKIGEISGPCCICGGDFSRHIDEEIICYSCGLRIHYQCYGISIPQSSLNRKLKSYKWLCDPCSNDLHPIISTDYRCDLCYSGKIDEAIDWGQAENLNMDALKCTTAGSWVHVICAVFNADIKFGCSKFLQPIVNTNFVLLKDSMQTCSICQLQGGGLIKCEFCSVQFHASCANSRPDFHLKIKKVKHTNLSNDGKAVLLSNGIRYELSPVGFCNQHQCELLNSTHLFFPLNWKITDTSETLLQLFCKFYKDCSNTSNVYLRYLEQQSFWRGNLVASIIPPVITPAEVTCESDCRLTNHQPKTCSRCGVRESIAWYENFCHICHISQPSGQRKITDITESWVAEGSQIGPCISELDAASILDAVLPVGAEVKSEKRSKSLSKTGNNGCTQSPKWVAENPGKL